MLCLTQWDLSLDSRIANDIEQACSVVDSGDYWSLLLHPDGILYFADYHANIIGPHMYGPEPASDETCNVDIIL